MEKVTAEKTVSVVSSHFLSIEVTVDQTSNS